MDRCPRCGSAKLAAGVLECPGVLCLLPALECPSCGLQTLDERRLESLFDGKQRETIPAPA